MGVYQPSKRGGVRAAPASGVRATVRELGQQAALVAQAPSGARQPSPAAVLALQQSIGNRAVQRLLARQPQRAGSAAPVQRLVANVGKLPLAKLDWITLKTIGVALELGGEGQQIAEWAEADWGKVKPNEPIYLVGHGSAGKLGALGDLKELGAMLAARLPKDYAGEIISLSCRAGQREKATSPLASRS